MGNRFCLIELLAHTVYSAYRDIKIPSDSCIWLIHGYALVDDSPSQIFTIRSLSSRLSCKHLCDFMSDHSLCSCDLLFKNDVLFTYERDDGLCCSWIDHVLCSQSFSSTISNVRAVHSGSILSDHFPLLFTLEADHLPVNYTEPVSSKKLHRIDWTRVTHTNITVLFFGLPAYLCLII